MKYKSKQWMINNGYSLPLMKDLDNAILQVKFKDLFELMELYALQHQLSEFKKEIDKIFRTQ